MAHSHQFCVRPADGNPVIAVWTSDHAVHIDLVRWVVATRMEYALRAGHCTISDYDPHDCDGTPFYHLDARGPAITDDTLHALVWSGAREMIAAIMTIGVVQVAAGKDPIWDTRVLEPAPDHASDAYAELQRIWKEIHTR